MYQYVHICSRRLSQIQVLNKVFLTLDDVFPMGENHEIDVIIWKGITEGLFSPVSHRNFNMIYTPHYTISYCKVTCILKMLAFDLHVIMHRSFINPLLQGFARSDDGGWPIICYIICALDHTFKCSPHHRLLGNVRILNKIHHPRQKGTQPWEQSFNLIQIQQQLALKIAYWKIKFF